MGGVVRESVGKKLQNSRSIEVVELLRSFSRVDCGPLGLEFVEDGVVDQAAGPDWAVGIQVPYASAPVVAGPRGRIADDVGLGRGDPEGGGFAVRLGEDALAGAQPEVALDPRLLLAAVLQEVAVAVVVVGHVVQDSHVVAAVDGDAPTPYTVFDCSFDFFPWSLNKSIPVTC